MGPSTLGLNRLKAQLRGAKIGVTAKTLQQQWGMRVRNTPSSQIPLVRHAPFHGAHDVSGSALAFFPSSIDAVMVTQKQHGVKMMSARFWRVVSLLAAAAMSSVVLWLLAYIYIEKLSKDDAYAAFNLHRNLLLLCQFALSLIVAMHCHRMNLPFGWPIAMFIIAWLAYFGCFPVVVRSATTVREHLAVDRLFEIYLRGFRYAVFSGIQISGLLIAWLRRGLHETREPNA